MKNCENETAQQIASLVEQFFMKSIEINIDFARCQVEQIYKHADKFMKGQD